MRECRVFRSTLCWGQVVTSRDQRYQRDPAKDRLEAILERALTAYHGDELHGGARWMGERILDAELVPVAREAFLDADDLPADHEVLQAFDHEPMRLLGEGYHVIALVQPSRRFVVKYAKHLKPVPPLARAMPAARQEWDHDHGVRPDGSLHPAIWQHIRAFEAYGPLAVPSRVYIADSALGSLSADERRALERFRSIGIVRSLGSAPRLLLVNYPDELAELDPELPLYDAHRVSDLIDRSLVDRRTPAVLAAGFALVALLLASLGVYGVLAYQVSQRTREIGIRIALGSDAPRIFRLVLGEGVVLVGAGALAGLAGAMALRRTLEAQLYGIDVMDPLVLLIVVASLAVVALIAIAIPARRAARTNPIAALTQV